VTLHSTVVPDGVLGLDLDGEDLVADLILHVEVAAVEGGAVYGITGLGEAALGDRVEALVEVELDSIADFGLGLGGGEVEAALSDFDDVVGSEDGVGDGGEGHELCGGSVHICDWGVGDNWKELLVFVYLFPCLLWIGDEMRM
jgi:hypothetical protein